MWIFKSNYLQTFYILFLLQVIGASWFAIDILPSPNDRKSSSEIFSAERAHEHVKNIAAKPRPLGTSSHEATKAYLISELSQLGCSVRSQKSNAVTQWVGYVYSAPIENIICILPGRDPDAVMLVSHYDSVHNSPGAADSAAGISILLETARAVSAAEKPRNTLILLFTDGEENGLKGASAFVRSKYLEILNVKIVLNFEARGNSGPLALFETHKFNSQTALAMSKLSRPVGNSFLDFLYQFLPNNTDLSVLKSAKIPALNFAFAKGLEHYHHSSDTPENLSLETLQHGGDTALKLATYYLDANLAILKNSSKNVIYQDILSFYHVNYPASLVKWVSVLCIIAIIFCIWAWGVPALKIFVASLGAVLFLALNLIGALYFQKLAVAIWGFDQVVINFYSVFWTYVLTVMTLIHFLFMKVKLRFPELPFGILSLLLLGMALLQYYPEVGSLILWSSLGVIWACVRPSWISRNLALLPICLLIPEFLHTSLIADSGTQLVLPTLILSFGIGLIHLVLLNPHIRARTNHRSVEVTGAGAGGFGHGVIFVLGAAYFITLVAFSIPRNSKRNIEFFELSANEKLYVATSKSAGISSSLLTAVNEVDSTELLSILRPFWIRSEDFDLFETPAVAPEAPKADFTLWESSESYSQYLIDIPAQPYDCVTVYLIAFEKIQKLTINSMTPYAIPPKKFSADPDPYIIESCDLKRSSLRIEFKIPPNIRLPRETMAVFSKSTLPPKELNLGDKDTIWARYSNVLYVLKKITL